MGIGKRRCTHTHTHTCTHIHTHTTPYLGKSLTKCAHAGGKVTVLRDIPVLARLAVAVAPVGFEKVVTARDTYAIIVCSGRRLVPRETLA